MTRTAFRIRWELETRAGLRARSALPPLAHVDSAWTARLPFADPAAVADAMTDRIPTAHLARLREEALDAQRGRIRCFGWMDADYGDPPDWFLDPQTGRRRNANTFWSRALSERGAGDIKLTWEIARFPHAYAMARAAAFFPEIADGLADSLVSQFRDFASANPPRRGPHWASAQEVALRNLAWCFALDALLEERFPNEGPQLVARAVHTGARHTLDVIEYAEKAVYNNHLLSEALGLYLAGALLGERDCRAKGRSVLEHEANAQFYSDGGYILLSLNYERAALQLLLFACAVARAEGSAVPDAWLRAMDRAVTFMVAHQNPADGRMPNVGPNDGSLPCPLSTCDILDFRPTLQAVSVVARGERLYEPGPWDEETGWWAGPAALDAPLRPPKRRSISFPRSGFHVLRRDEEPATFATFRCGTLPDRFGQIDMLHTDLWWRGLNVAVDPGTFMYDVDDAWLRYFDGTAGHNTIVIDGEDQMILFRRFKHLYPTHARLTGFGSATMSGEHYGYRRLAGRCVHRRQINLDANGFTIEDEVTGTGRHRVGLHWLLGTFPWEQQDGLARVVLETPAGPFAIEVRLEDGAIARGTVVAGASDPPRGWVSREYARKIAVASLSVELEAELPVRLTTVARGI